MEKTVSLYRKKHRILFMAVSGFRGFDKIWNNVRIPINNT